MIANGVIGGKKLPVLANPAGAAQSHAIQRGHPNGDMEAALAYSTSIKHKIKDHLTTIGVHSLIDD